MSALELRKQIRSGIVKYCIKYMGKEDTEMVRKFVEKKTDEAMRARLKLIKGGKSE